MCKQNIGFPLLSGFIGGLGGQPCVCHRMFQIPLTGPLVKPGKDSFKPDGRGFKRTNDFHIKAIVLNCLEVVVIDPLAKSRKNGS